MLREATTTPSRNRRLKKKGFKPRHNDAHTTPTRIAMSSSATLGVTTRAQEQKRQRDTHAGEAIPDLLNDIVVAHVLRSEYFDDPADLARLTAISHGSQR